MLFFHYKSFKFWPLETIILTFSNFFLDNSHIPLNMTLKKQKNLYTVFKKFVWSHIFRWWQKSFILLILSQFLALNSPKIASIIIFWTFYNFYLLIRVSKLPAKEKIEEKNFNIFQKWLPIMTLCGRAIGKKLAQAQNQPNMPR